jgi:hypothetical protein
MILATGAAQQRLGARLTELPRHVLEAAEVARIKHRATALPGAEVDAELEVVGQQGQHLQPQPLGQGSGGQGSGVRGQGSGVRGQGGSRSRLAAAQPAGWLLLLDCWDPPHASSPSSHCLATAIERLYE